MFSLNKIDIVDFGASTNSNDSINVDHIMTEEQLHHDVLYEDVFSIKDSAGKGEIPFRVKENENFGLLINDDLSAKKAMHREIERQRRREMANLYASLRSLLPPQYIKGKRSISDHMREAVNYIKDTQKKIEKLETHRDKLRKVVNSCSNNKNEITDGDAAGVSFTLNVYGDGAEILINSKPDEDERGFFGLSRIIKELTERGHNIISCVSTKAHGGSLHRIELEDSNISNMDLSELQERLTEQCN